MVRVSPNKDHILVRSPEWIVTRPEVIFGSGPLEHDQVFLYLCLPARPGVRISPGSDFEYHQGSGD